MKIQGLHHITLVASNAQRTVDFYVKVLGLRLLKQTVNFDDPGSYHLYFGDTLGTPGSAITFFEWPHAPRGRHGIGGTHHVALQVTDLNGLLKWKRRLVDLGLKVEGPFDRLYFQSIYFRDPDGVILEIATQGPGWSVDETAETLGTTLQTPPAAMTLANRDAEKIAAEMWHEPVPVITADMALMFGMHHITAISSDIQRTHEFFTHVLGMRRLKMTVNFDDPDSAHWYWGVDEGRPGTVMTYFERKTHDTQYAQVGIGLTHHYALAVANEDEQWQWRKRFMEAGYRVSPIAERVYFKSIYSNDPDGHIVELATVGPGFMVDEPDVNTVGQKLMLPPWLEKHRTQIENHLTPLIVPEWIAPSHA